MYDVSSAQNQQRVRIVRLLRMNFRYVDNMNVMQLGLVLGSCSVPHILDSITKLEFMTFQAGGSS